MRDNLATLLAEAGELGRGLPRYVERDFAKYLECGVLAHGFARVRCESCKDELLVAFSCKGRGVCPSCNAKRAQVTAVHLVEQVLPRVPYRQWMLSFPHRVRWVLLKDVRLLSDVLTVFLRAVFALQRRRARRQGIRHGQVGAVSFIQFFGSALQVTPHFHSLVPDGVFVPEACRAGPGACEAPFHRPCASWVPYGCLVAMTSCPGRRRGGLHSTGGPCPGTGPASASRRSRGSPRAVALHPRGPRLCRRW
ncbi:transposase zinc-binding domain-containing protein [Myxococcus xanthus]|uniref:transposase zinc-binding domain-containing protein n=1 Tax=Myxococcus xanthus TaxID=34 RepID=UPI003AB7B932